MNILLLDSWNMIDIPRKQSPMCGHSTNHDGNNDFHGPVDEVSDGRSSETPDSSQPLPVKASPFTLEFFSDLAETITRSFPFEKFAKDHDCEVADVLYGITTTVINPLSKRYIEEHQVQAPSETSPPAALRTPAEPAEDESVASTSRSAPAQGRTSRRSERRKTLVPVGRTLVYKDVYGNYVPVERKKEDTSQDRLAQFRRKVEKRRRDLETSSTARPPKAPKYEALD
ncbi:uncharacterized protein BJX67DRAFT_357591 [Aspergillus lucknowensis]|uniref:CUE domain-containing protein n=1 Tax=Aspergillus lucknowensis TaxID=176173 RepID=A0ABR4LM47_9EURO